MKNKDVLMQEKTKILQKMNEAIEKNDADAFAAAFEELSQNIQENILNEVDQQRQAADVAILNGRGVRQLTSDETKYYQAVIEAMKSSNPKQALTDLDVVMPKTVIDRVFEDLSEQHPLLEEIDFQNTSGLVEMYMNTDEVQLASWGTLTGTITKELTSGFKKVNMSLKKLSAFLPVCKAMLDLGPTWIDRYVREVLTEAIYNGLEKGIIAGTGKDEPIGMLKKVGDDVSVTGGAYPDKDAVAVKKLDAKTYGELLAKLAKTPTGTYTNNVFPYPTVVIQSTQVPEGKAVLGIGKKYFMGIGTAKSGKIEYSDDYHFLEDERVYLTKLYGHGEPVDNNAFLVLDISKLEPAILKVAVENEAAGE